MSLILAVSTSGASVSAALIKDGTLLGIRALHGASYSATLMPMVDELLNSFGVDCSDITAYAADTGPGSFTGVRIGVCAVNGMAFATKTRVIGVSSLLALSYVHSEESKKLIVSVIDARNDNVYAAIYDAGRAELVPPQAMSVEELFEAITRTLAQRGLHARDILFVGDGVEAYRMQIEAAFSVILPTSGEALPLSAALVGYAAYDILLADEANEKLGFALPTYLKLSQAEMLMKKREPVPAVPDEDAVEGDGEDD